MRCPLCGGDSKVIETRRSLDDKLNERYRERICLDCGEYFYSVETVVPASIELRNKWVQTDRAKKSRENAKELRERTKKSRKSLKTDI